MSQRRIACADMVRAQIGRQCNLNLQPWGGGLTPEEARLVGEVYMLERLREGLAIPYVRMIRISVESSFDEQMKEFGYFSSHTSVEFDLPDGHFVSVDSSELDSVAYELDDLEDGYRDQVPAYRDSLDRLQTYFADVEKFGGLHCGDFWRHHDGNLQVSREQFLKHCHGEYLEDLDVIGLADEVFARQREPLPDHLAPVRWTRYEIARVAQRLEAGMPPDAMDEGGLTALNAALWCGFYTTALRLLDAGADPNLPDVSGITPLATAVYRNRPEILDHLLEAGADINGPMHCRTALFALVDRTSPPPLPLQELLDRGLDIETRMPDGGRLTKCRAHAPVSRRRVSEAASAAKLGCV